jgi:Fe-S-cluster containining protein
MEQARNSNFGFAVRFDSNICKGLKRLIENARKDYPRTHCIRCGECCLGSSPTLQAQDLSLVEAGDIAPKDLYTIRKGELVWDNVIEGLTIARQEVIKIKEKQEGRCIFYDHTAKACTIYEKRPAQCSAMACWDTPEFIKVYKEAKLMRENVIKDRVLLGLIEAHEKRCSYEELQKHVKAIETEGEKAVEKIIELLKLDFQMRPFLLQKLGLNPDEMDFLFGRPLADTIVMFGLKVIREPGGTFLLTIAESKKREQRNNESSF